MATTAFESRRPFPYLLVLKHDPAPNTERSVYSLRHPTVCMRGILTHGQLYVFDLAKNADTSVNQIERFYVRHPPLSREMAKNLKSFEEGQWCRFHM